MQLFKQTQMTNENKQSVTNEFSENELLTRYRNGDEDAFREVVNRYKNSLYTFLRRFTDNLEVIGYAFQETFLQLYTTRDSFDTNRPLRPWLFTVAANKAEGALQKMPRQSAFICFCLNLCKNRPFPTYTNRHRHPFLYRGFESLPLRQSFGTNFSPLLIQTSANRRECALRESGTVPNGTHRVVSQAGGGARSV